MKYLFDYDRYYLIRLTLLFILIAYFYQNHLYTNGDVCWLLHNSALLFKGGHYVTNTFETNPPLICYLYLPVILLSQLTGWSTLAIFQWYIYGIIIVTLIMCQRLLLCQKEPWVQYSILYSFLLCVLFLPGLEFGQRDYIYAILLLPYVLAVNVHLTGQRVSPLFAIFIGIWAGCGVGLKPNFLLPILLLEGFVCLKKRSIFAWLRIELITCAAVVLSSVWVTWLTQPQYFAIILPLVFHWYYPASHQTWLQIFSELLVVYVVGIALIFLYFYKSFPYKILSTVLWLALVGFIAEILILRNVWYYHALPALIYACILSCLCVAQLLLPYIKTGRLKNYEIAIFYLIVALVPRHYVYEENDLSQAIFKNTGIVELTAYVQDHPELRSVYCFSANTTADCFPLVNVTKRQYGGRFPFFWWVSGLVAAEDPKTSRSKPPYFKQEKHYLLQQVAWDLAVMKPDVVIISIADEKLVMSKHFDFITYFSTEPTFAAAWQHYRYLTHIKNYDLYERVN